MLANVESLKLAKGASLRARRQPNPVLQRRARSDAPHRQVSLLNPKPLPRTSLEPVCEALAGVIRKRRIQRGLSLNRLAELTRL